MKLIVQSLLRPWFFAFPIGYRLSRGWSLIPNRSRCGLTRRTWWMESFIRYGWRNFFFFFSLSSPLLSSPAPPPNRFVEQHAHRHRETRFIAAFHPFVPRLFSFLPGFSIVFLSSTVGNPTAEKRNILFLSFFFFFQFESFKVIT